MRLPSLQTGAIPATRHPIEKSASSTLSENQSNPLSDHDTDAAVSASAAKGHRDFLALAWPGAGNGPRRGARTPSKVLELKHARIAKTIHLGLTQRSATGASRR